MEQTLTIIKQGDIFQKIIEDVSAASQNDFEENGVQPQTLKELQQVSVICLCLSFLASSRSTRQSMILRSGACRTPRHSPGISSALISE